jgi:Ca2+-binding EF-hand superfamily protein
MQIEAMHILINHLDVEELKELRKTFNQFDTHGTGTLSFDEIKECLDSMGFDVASEEVLKIIGNCGNHGD